MGQATAMVENVAQVEQCGCGVRVLRPLRCWERALRLIPKYDGFRFRDRFPTWGRFGG